MEVMEVTVYNQEAEAVGKIDLPEAVFSRPWNADMVHQVVTNMASNRRSNLASVKDRGEVAGGGRKPWRQKGTGRARHGSIRSPIWRGGGVSHGPVRERNYSKKINQRMKRQALQTIIAAKWRAGQLLFLDDLRLAVAKTSEAKRILENLSRLTGFKKVAYQSGKRALIALPIRSEETIRSFRNLPAVQIEEARNLNPLDTLRYQNLILVRPSESLKAIL